MENFSGIPSISAKISGEMIWAPSKAYFLRLCSCRNACQSNADADAVAVVAVAAVAALVNGARTQSLYEALLAVYAENGIVVSTKTSDWAAQRTKLLHKAEELLMQDMPVIPVVFNQDAVLINSEYLKKVTTTYYTPANFQKTKMKDYLDYFYYDEEEEKTISIFKNFPEILWEKVGK